jgi:ABC-type uncharacterized transport system permease subunit
MNAFQLSVPPAMAGAYFLSAMATVVLVITAVTSLFDITPATIVPIIRSEAFLVGMSTALWIAAAVAFWWSWRRVGHYMTSYVGEAPKA